MSPTGHSRSRRLAALSSVLMSRFTGTALQLAFTVLVARALGAEASGYVFTWMAWSIFAAAMLSLGAPAYVLREVSKAGRERRLALSAIYLQITAAACVTAVVIVAATAAVSRLVPPAYERLLLLSVASAHAILMLEVATSALIGMGREGAGILLRFVSPPFAMCVFLVACTAAGTTPGTPAIAAVYVASALVLAAVADRLYRRWTGVAPRFQPARTRATRGRLWSINVVNALYMGLPFFVLPYFAHAREIAYFAIGYRLTNVAQTASVALGVYFSPRFARAHRNGDDRGLRRLFHASQLASLAVLAPLAVFLTPFGPVALRLFGSDFAGAWLYVAIPVAARLLIAGCGLTEQFLAMTHNENREVAVSSVALVVLAVTSLAAVRSYGTEGLCAAFYGISVVKFAVACLASLMVLYRDVPLASAIAPEAHQASRP